MPAARFGSGRLHEQVHVVLHQAVREAPPAVAHDDLLQQQQVGVPIVVVDVDRVLADAASEHMHDGAGELFARLASHTTQ